MEVEDYEWVGIGEKFFHRTFLNYSTEVWLLAATSLLKAEGFFEDYRCLKGENLLLLSISVT